RRGSRSRPGRTRSRGARPSWGALLGTPTAAGPGRRRPGAPGRGEDWPGRPRRRPLPPPGWRAGAAALAHSGAVPAVHPGLVRQLTSMLDEVALPAHELGRLLGNDLDGERLDALFSPQRQNRLVVLLLVGGRALFRLLGENVIQAGLGGFGV